MRSDEDILTDVEYFKGYRIATSKHTRWHVMLDSKQRLTVIQHYFKEFIPYN